MTALITNPTQSDLVQLKTVPNSSYILITDHDEKFNKYLKKKASKQYLEMQSKILGLPIKNRNNRSAKYPDSLIFYHREQTIIHKTIALHFFCRV